LPRLVTRDESRHRALKRRLEANDRVARPGAIERADEFRPSSLSDGFGRHLREERYYPSTKDGALPDSALPVEYGQPRRDQVVADDRLFGFPSEEHGRVFLFIGDEAFVRVVGTSIIAGHRGGSLAIELRSSCA